MISKHVRRAAIAKRQEFLAKKGVLGVMSGREEKGGKKTGRSAVVVLVKQKLSLVDLDEADFVPSSVMEGEEVVPTDVIEVGEIRALHTNKHRPIVPGTSIGHFEITAGTLGVVVRKGGEEFILSNNHVLANTNAAAIGDRIYQPGPIDGGKDGDTVATLAQFVPINFSGSNLVDCALARFVSDPEPDPEPPTPDPEPPTPPKDNDSNCKIAKIFTVSLNKVAELFGRETRLKAVRPVKLESQDIESQATEGVDYDNTPLNLGVTITKQLAIVDVGDTVQKSGRTTGVTVDEVIGLDAAVDVSYGSDGTGRFVDQIICGPMSAGGDSGSVVYDAAGNAIGLLFAGSDTITILNPIQDVFTLLGIDEIA